MDLTRLRVPIVQAPLAGGASTPRLAAAVAQAGGLGFLAAGYKTADAVRDDIHELRGLTSEPFGVNVFAPPADDVDEGAVSEYASLLEPDAERLDAGVGRPRHDDDHFDAKLELLAAERVAVVSFTFGCPHRQTVDAVHQAGSDVWVTVTSPDEAQTAQAAGADALVVQGFEAGGHRGYFADRPGAPDLGLLALLRLTANRVGLPLIATGGIADGASVAAVLCAGAVAAQIGTALMLTPEAGTSAPQRAALRDQGATALTRAFTGRQARGIVNDFMQRHADHAPIAYPDVHHLTAPIRAAARQAGDPEAINLWAGQTHELAQELPAAEVVARLAEDARRAIEAVAARLPNG
jgi:nitronate monooxygenase